MSALAQLPALDLSAELARLPLRPGAQRLAPRGPELSITFHFSDVIYARREREVEQPRILDEARYQIAKNWNDDAKGPPIYGDGLMYDFVVLSDGTIVRTRGRRQRLWHCRNAVGNASSWATHVMLGRGQDLTTAQRTSVFALWDALRADGNIPRENVFSHCEWPVGKGAGGAVRSATYRPQPGQSLCPGAQLHADVVAYRAAGNAPGRYRVASPTVARIAPDATAAVAWDGTCNLPVDALLDIDSITNGWAHWPAAGFVLRSALEHA